MRRRPGRNRRPVALTGTPGTGKSAVAARLRDLRTVEVDALAVRWGLARGPAGRRTVDLPAMVRRARRPGSLRDVDVVVGHLAHLLPLRDVVVLRCRPDQLGRRLRSAGRGTAAERRENALSEALDGILLEAVGRGRRVAEVDTTDRTVAEIAREVRRRLARRRGTRHARVRWLSDRRVTDHLLDPPR